MSVRALIDEARLIVCVGPGGVGKTTVSAAIALGAAQRGRRVAVVTIDPARRLADAMGLDGLDDTLRPVFYDEASGGSLDAAMIETRGSYDALIRRLVGEESAARILNNVVYRGFSRTLARSHAYIAMERLHHVLESRQYDLVVLDTPPTRSALEIVDAPTRLARFLDEGVVSWFLEAAAGAEPSAVARTSGALAARLLSLVASRKLVRELSAFLGLLYEQRAGFARRAEATGAALRSDSTGFFLVTSVSPTSLDDAQFLANGLAARGVALAATVFNRAYWAEPGDDARPLESGGDAPITLDSRAFDWLGEADRSLVERDLNHALGQASEANRRAQAIVDRFVTDLGCPTSVARLPDLDMAVHDLDGLARLAAILLAP